MTEVSRRRFLQLTAATGGALAFGDLIDRMLGLTGRSRTAAAGEPIKIGIIDPLSSPYKTSSIHDVHGAMLQSISITSVAAYWDGQSRFSKRTMPRILTPP